jgi:NAD(P)-dependent dehydrogenase (short-subunit alcohol dehydrogenase family)
MFDLHGKRLAITGGGGALGRAAALRAAQLGASVSALDVAFSEAAPALPDTIGRSIVDLTDAAATQRCFDALGLIDAIFNIAGGFLMGPAVHELSEADMARMFKVNVTTMHNAVRAVAPGMIARRAGSIVNVGAVAATSGLAHMGAYCAAKSMVMRLTESMAAELRGHNINVNAVLPGIIDTPANRAAMPDANPDEWVAPDELANVICFLASEAASAVHGALIPVRGLS